LGVCEDLDRGIWQADEVFQAFVWVLGEVLAVEGGLGAEEVLLDAERGFFWANEGYNKDGVGFAKIV